MARIYGTIESLKSLKSELEDKGISRFSSVKEVKTFLSNYNSEKLKILNDISYELEKEYLETCTKLEQRIQRKNEIINLESEKINTKVSDLQAKIDLIKNNKAKSFFEKLTSSVKLYILKNKLNHFLINKRKLISSSVKEISKKIENDELFIKKYETEKQKLI